MERPSDVNAVPNISHRQKRRQVAKACNNCRVLRIKCDNYLPCTNCKTRASHCSNTKSNSEETQTLQLKEAGREVARLKQKVQDLEMLLQAQHDDRLKTTTSSQNQLHLQSPPASLSSSSPKATLQLYDGRLKLKPAIKHWEGVQLRPARCSHAIFFGPSSLYYFISRFSGCLATSLRQSHPTVESMLLQSASSGKLLEGLSLVSEDDQDDSDVPSIFSLSSVGPESSGPNLTATQEEYFLNHFWQSYHTSSFAILDEAKFKKHHQSLWVSSCKRKPSALVDIVLAMCMQHAVSTLPYSQQKVLAESNHNDATIAGRWYYRRCQTLLTYELERPTTSTLQCHLLCATYLCGGSFHNMVDTVSITMHAFPISFFLERVLQE